MSFMKQVKLTFKKWLDFAAEDLKVAHWTLKSEIYNQTCFHSQQVAEKALKAFLSKSGTIPKTHILTDLINLCAKKDSSFESFRKSCLILGRFYVPTRYPDAIPGSLPEGLPNREDASEALQIAEEILNFVKKEP